MSPFASTSEVNRVTATRTMLRKRTLEVKRLTKAHASATGVEKALLAQRLKAAKNNLTSWRAYQAKHSPRVPRATVHP